MVQYSQVFWIRYHELSDHEATLDKIQKGEEKLRRRDATQHSLSKIIHQYQHPLQQLYIPYGPTQKGKNYTEDEDRCVLPFFTYFASRFVVE